MSNETETPIAEKAHTHKIPLKEKLAFGAGGVGVGIQEYADNQILGPIFVVGMGISPALMGSLALFYRLWDALTDGLMGWATDNTQSRWGRRKPYLFVGSILMSLAMPLMFMFNPNWAVSRITLWMIVFQLILTGTQTMYNIPYQCLALEMSPDSNERTSIQAWRSYFGVVTTLLSGWTLWLCMQSIFQPPGEKASAINGAPWVLGMYAILTCILGMLPVFVVKERTEAKRKKSKRIPILTSIKIALKESNFALLIAFVLTGLVGSGIVEVLGGYLRMYYVCELDMKLYGATVGTESIFRIFTSIAGIRFFQWLSAKTSKRKTLVIAMLTLLTGALSKFIFYTPDMPYLSILPVVLFLAPASSAVWMLILSMIGDIVDEVDLKTGERLEGTFSSVFSWIQKVTFALRSSVSGFLVVFVGFDTAKRKEMLPETVTDKMFLLLIMVPLVFKTLSFISLYFYRITNQSIRETREALDAR